MQPAKPGLAEKWTLKQVRGDGDGWGLRLRIAFFAAIASFTLTGCGLKPMYAGGASSPVAQGLASIDVGPIEGKAGWMVRNALVDRLGVAGANNKGGSSSTRYRLDVRLDDKLEGLGLLSNDTISRERRTLRARYQLVDSANGAILLDATAGSDAGIDVVSSEYATIAAEQTALENLSRDVADRIVTKLAQQLQSGQTSPATP